MPCYKPLTGYPTGHRLPSGKRAIVFNPLQGWRDRPILIPCGQCVGCRLERSRQWAIRCYHEASLYEENSFVTLTYRDADLPIDGSISLREVQLFMKRLRKRFVPRNPHTKQSDAWHQHRLKYSIRFYGCGEYGDENARPHYHICLFNFDPPDKKIFKISKNDDRYYSSEILDEIWGFGYTITGEVTFQSAAYVARYIMKKITGPGSDHHYENVDQVTGEISQREPEFTTMSRRPGIGKNWLAKFHPEVYPSDHIIINGKKVRAPKYYDKIFEADDPNAFADLRINRIRNARKHSDNNTPQRLRVRETVQLAKIKHFTRTLEK